MQERPAGRGHAPVAATWVQGRAVTRAEFLRAFGSDGNGFLIATPGRDTGPAFFRWSVMMKRTDSEIERDCIYALHGRVAIPRAVSLRVRDGRVTLAGTVSWLYQRMAAESAVKYVRGVTGVANDIVVGIDGPSAGQEDTTEIHTTCL